MLQKASISKHTNHIINQSINQSRNKLMGLGDTSVNGVNGFSIDVEDLFYLLPRDGLLGTRDVIDYTGELEFQNLVGLTTDNFITLLEFYLPSTVINHDGIFYIQRTGICIGSSIAPILSDIYLSSIDKRICAALADSPVLHIYRYVDDYLVLLKQRPGDCFDDEVKNILRIFSMHGGGPKFTFEMPNNDSKLQFLDINVSFASSEHVCWAYHPRSNKGLLPYDSAHPNS